MDAGNAAIHDDHMSKSEVIRAVLLVVLGASCLAFDLYIVQRMPISVSDVFRVLAMLHGELTLLFALAVYWPHHRLLRLILGGAVMAMVWLAVAELADVYFLFRPTLIVKLVTAFLMVASFSVPCVSFFILNRRIFGTRFSILGRSFDADDRVQFGIRHLLLFTTCFAFVAFAASAVFPDSLPGQFAPSFNRQEVLTMSALCLFPGLAAGPIALAIMRPSWHMIWIVPWILVLGVAELILFEWWLPSSITPNVTEVLQTLSSVAGGYVELVVVLVVVFGLTRIGGVKLE